LSAPLSAVVTFREGNMGRPLCKEITIVDDCVPEMLEEFGVWLSPVNIVGVQAKFNPAGTTVKITDNDAPNGKLQCKKDVCMS